MRGVVLTAAEMNAADRFSFVLVEEQNLLSGNLEDITIEGVTDVLNKRKNHPEAVLLFTVCLHHFVGSNLNYSIVFLTSALSAVIWTRLCKNMD